MLGAVRPVYPRRCWVHSRWTVRSFSSDALALGLTQARQGIARTVPRYSATGALARNLALYPVVLFHGFRRLIPF